VENHTGCDKWVDCSTLGMMLKECAGLGMALPIPSLRGHRFTGRSQRRISLLGIVISKFQYTPKVHQSVRAQLETSAKLPVFKDVIRQSNQLADVAEKYGGENGENALSLISLGCKFLFRARKRDAAL
jgi:hypothetical protein